MKFWALFKYWRLLIVVDAHSIGWEGSNTALRPTAHRYAVRGGFSPRRAQWVVLPDHLHAVIELPPGDADFATRWRLIKAGFSRRLPATERRSAVRVARGERGIWQRRFWEHLIRDERDFAAHMDYVHFNPVKRGRVAIIADWPCSTFHAWVADGIYPADWGGSAAADAVVCPD